MKSRTTNRCELFIVMVIRKKTTDASVIKRQTKEQTKLGAKRADDDREHLDTESRSRTQETHGAHNLAVTRISMCYLVPVLVLCSVRCVQTVNP